MGLLEFRNNEPFQFSLKILLSMIPAGLVGFFYSEQLERLFDKQILLVGLMLLVRVYSYLSPIGPVTPDKDVSFSRARIGPRPASLFSPEFLARAQRYPQPCCWVSIELKQLASPS